MSTQNKSYFKDLVGTELYNKISSLYEQTKKGNEFEINIVNRNNEYFGQEKYIQILKYMKHKGNILKSKCTTLDSLDITYTMSSDVSFRVSLNGSDIINKYIQKLDLWKSHVIFKSLVKIAKQRKSDEIVLMKKIKTKDNLIDVPDLHERIKLAQEEEFEKSDFDMIDKISHEQLDMINFRLKQRTSLKIVDNDKDFFQIDLTVTKTAKRYSSLNSTIPIYELELEYGLNDSKIKPMRDTFDTMMQESMILHKIIQQSQFVITKSKTDEVLKYYKNIANVNESSNFLDARQPISLEIQYTTDILPNRYAVTDKADGDRYFLIIMNKHVYFISTNLIVKDSGIVLNDSKYDGTILDGEYIFIAKQNRHLLLIFDVLFIGNKDIRPERNFMKRIKQGEDLCNEIFVLKNQKGYKRGIYKSSTDKFDLNELKLFHHKEYIKQMKALNEDMLNEKSYPLIRTKYFAEATGAVPWEIFTYAEDMWKSYTEDSEVGCPYLLDGLIFQPLEQPYVTSQRESKFFEYKWKSPTKNSIDFYIQFEKDKNTGKVLTVYDNSNDDYIRNKPYRICKLYNGRFSNNKEVPELFLEEKGIYWSYLFLEDGEARDVEGNIILDSTVVEFYYDSSEGEDVYVPEKFRWRPLRTRYDKTESVLRFGRKYGNNADVAVKIWRSIQTPILMSDFKDLSRGNNPDKNQFFYDKKIEYLRQKIGHELIVSASKQNVYFQKISNLAKPLRTFHRWITSNIIYTYCNSQYQGDRQLTVFDLGCGRGAENMKFYYVAVSLYVGVDVAKEGLYSAVDGAISRYNQQRKSKPNFPKMYFIHGDCGAKLNYEEQNRVLGGMLPENKQLIDRFFGKNPTKFDVVNSQFVIHYLLENETTWTNLKHNLNLVLRDGGYFIISHFDAEKVLEYLGDNNIATGYYTDDKGKKEKLFEIVKKFSNLDKTKPIGPGNAIDLFAAWMFEDGSYQTEYLVDYKFLKEDLLKDCDMELVETDLFENQFKMNKDFFKNYQQYMHNPDTRKFLTGVASYYEDTELNKVCYEYSFLQRYSIFRKKDKKKSNSTSDKNQKGGVVEYKVLSKSKYDDSYSFMNSIHYILRSHEIIPKSLSVGGFYKEHEIKMVRDIDLTDASMKKICKSIKISHEIEKNSKSVVDGINVQLFENNKVKDYVKLKGERKSVVLVKDDGIFNPVYVKYNGEKHGMFKPDNNILDKVDLF
jgi:SAM-dependent methyltransferase